MNLPAACGRALKDFLSVTAGSLATQQSYGKGSLRFSRALKDDHVILRKYPWGAMSFLTMIRA
jgi:hypothetical protein